MPKELGILTLAVSFILCALTGTPAQAGGVGTITGRVVEVGTGVSLVGASVAVEGTRSGDVSDAFTTKSRPLH